MGKTRKDRNDFDKRYEQELAKSKIPSRKRQRNRENFNEFRNVTVDDVLNDYDQVGEDN